MGKWGEEDRGKRERSNSGSTQVLNASEKKKRITFPSSSPVHITQLRAHDGSLERDRELSEFEQASQLQLWMARERINTSGEMS